MVAPNACGTTHRPPWVVADWKHRVPENNTAWYGVQDSCGRAMPAAGSSCAALAEVLPAQGQRRSTQRAEFAALHKSIRVIESRCQAIQDTYCQGGSAGGATSSSGGGGAAARTPGGVRLTMRSGALQQGRSCGARRPRTVGDKCNGPETIRWVAPVDLNPGLNFRAGGRLAWASMQRLCAWRAMRLACALHVHAVAVGAPQLQHLHALAPPGAGFSHGPVEGS